jgi:predicted DNA-binding transcriptional regulator YafY
MKNKNAYARYRLIDARLNQKQTTAPTLEELVGYVSHKLGISISTSAMQKDIYAMRYDTNLGFNAPIIYERYSRTYKYEEVGYSINNIPVAEEDLQGLEMAIGILEQFKDVPAIKMFDEMITRLASSVKMNREKTTQGNILILDRPKRYKGIEYMNDIVDAIRTKHVIRLSYQPFSKKEPKKHTVHPYFIKEYNGRMYLIGKDIHATKEDKFLTFSFDRIVDIAELSQTFHEENFDQENYFTSAIGITLPNSKPEKIILQFIPEQANYLKSQPIHHSQIIIKDTDKYFTIELNLVINFELMMLLLSFGDRLKVLKPLALQEKIKTTIDNMKAKYEK